MLNLNDAQKIMNYYGFVNNGIEPMLCEVEDSLGIFATFKTKYGHLSRFIKFEEDKKMNNFFNLYLWYRKNLKDENLLVDFEEYESLSPNIRFLYNGIEATKDNINDIKYFSDNIEELDLDIDFEDNKKLVNILINNIKNTLIDNKKIEKELDNVINHFKEQFAKYNKLLNIEQKLIVDRINIINVENYDKKFEIIKNDITEKNISKRFEELLETYQFILTDDKYLENLYMIDYYNEEIRKINEKMLKFEDYNKMLENSKSKLFKSKKNKITFEQYLEENPIESKTIDKEAFIENKKIEAENKLIEWKNNSIDDLKKIYGISQNSSNKIISSKIITEEDLNAYFKKLNIQERNEALIISSPIKELINLIINLPGDKNKLDIIKNEPYYLDKFNDIYVILSSQDNYVVTRKYLKALRLDSLEEFIASIIEFTKNINIKPYILPKNNKLKFKIGVLLKNGYINASIKDNYPVNNRGANNYYLSSNKQNINVYFSPYIIKIDEDNNLIAIKNSDIISFAIDNLRLTNKNEVKVNNYMLKKEIVNKKIKYSFPVFNKKIYINSFIETGEKDE